MNVEKMKIWRELVVVRWKTTTNVEILYNDKHNILNSWFLLILKNFTVSGTVILNVIYLNLACSSLESSCVSFMKLTAYSLQSHQLPS